MSTRKTPKDRAIDDRRTFLKRAALGAAATAGLGVLAGCDSGDGSSCPPAADILPEDDVTTCPADMGPAWDRVVDVVVVGSGTGMAGALAAAVGGASVLVLEKSETTGGSTRLSGGVAWIPNNPVMGAMGFEDSREDAIAYLEKLSQGQATPELIEAFADGGPEMVEFTGQHASWGWRVAPLLGDYHPEWPGALIKGRSIEPDIAGATMTLGPQLVDGLVEAFEAAGGEVLTETPVTRLVTRLLDDGRQEVLGVVAEGPDGTQRIGANRGVLLAAGGFDWDFEMKTHFLRGPTNFTIGHPGNNGDGIRLAQTAGADLRNMNECWGGVVFVEDTKALHAEGKPGSIKHMIQRRSAGCISVNRHGKRFYNEASDYDSAWRPFFAWENWGDVVCHNVPAFQISDKKVKPTAKSGVQEAETVAELAEKLGIDPDGLEAQVERFNEFALLGEDPDFHRGESAYDTEYGMTLAPLDKPPFYGVEVAPADLGTCGGARVNGDAQVLGPMGQVVERLYASGNNAGVGGPGASYGGGGGTIGPGLTFAYLAGQHLLTLDALEQQPEA
jgi:3-oxosteroid 1-dehydrogenase